MIHAAVQMFHTEWISHITSRGSQCLPMWLFQELGVQSNGHSQTKMLRLFTRNLPLCPALWCTTLLVTVSYGLFCLGAGLNFEPFRFTTSWTSSSQIWQRVSSVSLFLSGNWKQTTKSEHKPHRAKSEWSASSAACSLRRIVMNVKVRKQRINNSLKY